MKYVLILIYVVIIAAVVKAHLGLRNKSRNIGLL